MALNLDIVLVCVTHYSGSSSCGHRSSNGYITSGYDIEGCNLYFSAPFAIPKDIWSKIYSVIHSKDKRGGFETDFTPSEYIERYSDVLTNKVINILNGAKIFNTVFLAADLPKEKFAFVYDTDYSSAKRLSINLLNDLLYPTMRIEPIFSHKLFELILKCEEYDAPFKYEWLNYIIRKGFVDLKSYMKNKVIFTNYSCFPIVLGSYLRDEYNTYYDYMLYPSIEACTNNEQINLLRKWVEAKNSRDYVTVNECEEKGLREWIEFLFERRYT